ncbi:molybdopterin biosynthesis protein moea [Heliomicrobium modesticaldum Ice1]|uniref:Molybdopterin molybdenumtransferase n=1 Tax=Heliobacterium modesticaldum (strain ATCC 51547 / Ice1) TaxID=498761 RepID=B0TBJ1_HELMI|nr:gephyrin-like molybdotransferase Glp [Heliomicrobium modesticaldum]ABZ85204.1 molybdopterin biosynthesis protein moea [Heliomicrobium modesticaldum Ice1]
MDFFHCISLLEAQDMIVKELTGSVVALEQVPLVDALGRVAAEDVVSAENLPPFSRSTVDGFAVRSADTFGASEAAPSLFTVVGEVLMGKSTGIELAPGQAAAIPTGGMLPVGADAVVMLEYAEQPDPHSLLIAKMIAPRENVIVSGEDIAFGSILLHRGQIITPAHIGVLAASGVTHVPVRQPVKVAIISTGDELVDIDMPVKAGQIRDVNSYALGALFTKWGCRVSPMGIVRDSYEKFYCALLEAVKTCQMVVISGGSSVGARDFTVKAIDGLGAPGVLFHGIAIKPGKPTIFGMVDRTPIFGLPGHPVAAMTVSEQLVKPAVRLLSGQKEIFARRSVPARLTRNVASSPGRDDFVGVRLNRQADGGYQAAPIFGKSGLIRLMAESDGIMHIPSDKSGVYEGETVEILLLNDADEGGRPE